MKPKSRSLAHARSPFRFFRDPNSHLCMLDVGEQPTGNDMHHPSHHLSGCDIKQLYHTACQPKPTCANVIPSSDVRFG